MHVGFWWVHPLAQPTPYSVGKDKSREEWYLQNHRAQDRDLVAQVLEHCHPCTQMKEISLPNVSAHSPGGDRALHHVVELSDRPHSLTGGPCRTHRSSPPKPQKGARPSSSCCLLPTDGYLPTSLRGSSFLIVSAFHFSHS